MQPYAYLKMTSGLNFKESEFSSEEKNSAKKNYDAFLSMNSGALQPIEISLRGNSSLTSAFLSQQKRFPLQLRVDASVGSILFDNPTLKIINCPSPALLLTQFIAMQAYRFLDVPTPQTAPVFIRINGENLGLFLAVEDCNEYFVRKYFDGSGSLYKQSLDGMYSRCLDALLSAKTDKGDDTFNHLEYAARHNMSVDSFLDIDKVLRFLACEAFVFDLDGIIYARRNFYLYDNHGKFVFFPWDKGEAFFHFKELNKNIYFFENNTDNKLVYNLLQNPEYRSRYHKYIQKLNDDFLDPDAFSPWLEQCIRAILPYAEQDPILKLYSKDRLLKLDSGKTLFNGFSGNLSETFNCIRRQLDQQLQGDTSNFYIPQGYAVAEQEEEDLFKNFLYGQSVSARICTGYWRLRRHYYWKAYGTQTVVVGCVFVVFTALAVLSVRIPKGGMRRRKKREDVWNE